MLYHIYELNHAFISPLREMVGLNKRLIQSQYNPFPNTWASKNMLAACDLFESVTRRYGKPDWRISETEIKGQAVPVEIKRIWQKSFCNLLHFKRDVEVLDSVDPKAANDPKVLLVAPMSGHHATLLRQTVEAFLPDHDVYVTDWIDAREISVRVGRFDLNDYIDYLIDMLEFLGGGVNVVGICQPGPPILAAVSILSAHPCDFLPASMIFMGSPIDTRLSPTIPNEVAKERSYEWFKNNMIYTVPWPNRGVGRRVYPGFLQLGGFITMNQDKHIDAHSNYFDHLVEGDCDSVQKHREFYDEYLAVLDLTEEFYLQTIHDIFQEHLLPRNAFYHRDELVRPENVTQVRLMTVEGERDDISGVGQTQAAHDLCSGIPSDWRVDYVQPNVGHYGVFSGKRFRTEIQPEIRKFIRGISQK
ncbi:polyhydroxyalkanoate depolymerase [Teredinibacter sp. KSP-S5-2]|uniref:polyhydroxyalkanoate depolymerase n=1 Tax=Teredinibacter sp. KSP-S5-2 TaxID=3034506 RepID=UPI0029342969|nr:polyhydroxyalkanoate depolymerase [Teredinibacter sp. KSP-S5-2]WNO07699.1 polyhydroxyalkanoate depolymerase [Teredinibacter sp. KSP-S5-2]